MEIFRQCLQTRKKRFQQLTLNCQDPIDYDSDCDLKSLQKFQLYDYRIDNQVLQVHIVDTLPGMV
jgi:hypothetical protein